MPVPPVPVERLTGIIQRLFVDKGYGFILAAKTDREYFLHKSACRTPEVWELLAEGQTVSFQPAETVKGGRALDVSADTNAGIPPQDDTADRLESRPRRRR
jgi:cold shock CspA family protein